MKKFAIIRARIIADINPLDLVTAGIFLKNVGFCIIVYLLVCYSYYYRLLLRKCYEFFTFSNPFLRKTQLSHFPQAVFDFVAL